MRQTMSWLHDAGFLWLRVLMGAGIATHGAQKIFGGKIGYFAQGIGQMGFPLPEFSAWVAALSEFAGGLCIALGFGTRFAALAIFVTMSVAAFLHHAADPFSKKELALAYWSIAGFLILTGAGRFSLDGLLKKRP